jgi:multidrug transporter EmrE-like cation transporter
MAWIYLLVAGLLEVAWAIGLKYTDGFTRLWPSAWTLVAMALSMVFLGLALRALPVGTAYAVWVGIGAVGRGARHDLVRRVARPAARALPRSDRGRGRGFEAGHA